MHKLLSDVEGGKSLGKNLGGLQVGKNSNLTTSSPDV